MDTSIATVWGRLSFLLGGASLGRRSRSGDILQATLETMDHGCLVIDRRLRILGSNRRAAEVLDVPMPMLNAGRNFADVIRLAANRGDYGDGDPDLLIRERLASAASGVAHSFDRQQPNGAVLSVRAQPLAEGGMVITYTDISEIRRLERELRASEERYALAISGARAAIWDWDIAGGKLVMSSRIAEILRLEPEDVSHEPGWWPRFIHHDDLGTFRRVMRDHIRGHTRTYEAEYRVRTATGDYRWVGDRGTCIRDGDGRAVRMAGSVDDITDRKDAERALQKAAATDALTGAFNRRKFMEMANVEMYRAQRYGSDLTVALLDLDHFKKINDTYGHAAGDKCLSAFVNLAYSMVRQSDILARFGGEEFVLMMPQSDLAGGVQLCDRIRSALKDLRFADGSDQIGFTVSVGVAEHRQGDSLEALLSRADAALYAAKDTGRNRVVAADEAGDRAPDEAGQAAEAHPAGIKPGRA